MYGDLLREPVPDCILDLITHLDRRGRGTIH
jgi:hypothetical protein